MGSGYRHGFKNIWDLLSSISLVGKITFWGTLLITYLVNLGRFAPGPRFIIPLAVSLFATIIVELIYKIFRNKSNF